MSTSVPSTLILTKTTRYITTTTATAAAAKLPLGLRVAFVPKAVTATETETLPAEATTTTKSVKERNNHRNNFLAWDLFDGHKVRSCLIFNMPCPAGIEIGRRIYIHRQVTLNMNLKRTLKLDLTCESGTESIRMSSSNLR
jgi:hypothetical protein